MVGNTIVGDHLDCRWRQSFTSFIRFHTTNVNFIHSKYHMAFTMAKFGSYFPSNLKVITSNTHSIVYTNEISGEAAFVRILKLPIVRISDVVSCSTLF